jgi:hypothetical protein
MSENGLSIHIKKAEGHELSERTASALEELAASVVQDLEREAEESEVSGFGALNVGQGLGAAISGPAPQDICIGWYSVGSGGSSDGDGGSKERGKESCFGIFY